MAYTRSVALMPKPGPVGPPVFKQFQSNLPALWTRKQNAVALWKPGITALALRKPQPNALMRLFGHHFQAAMENNARRVLAYGLEAEGRAPLRKSWYPPISDPHTSTHPFSKSTDGLDTKGPTTVDFLNNYTWREYRNRGKQEMSIFGRGREYITAVNLRARLRRFTRKSASRFGLEDGAQIEAFGKQLLGHPRYSPIRVHGASPQETHDIMRLEGITDPQKAMFRNATIRACKFGIEYGQLEGRKVLFELGGLNTTNAAMKQDRGRMGSDGTARRSVTNAELRKAFRHDLSDSTLQFFREGERVKAPWAEGGAEGKAWMGYMTDRMRKYAAKGFVHDGELAKQAFHGGGHRALYRELNRQIDAFAGKKRPGPPVK